MEDNGTWLALYHEYNIDLSRLEFLMVGEKKQKQYKWVTSVEELNLLSLPKILKFINTSIKEFLDD